MSPGEPYSNWNEVSEGFKDRLRCFQAEGFSNFHNDPMNQDGLLAVLDLGIREICEKKTFFLTKKGRMGIGPAFIMPFDRIFSQKIVSLTDGHAED